MHVPGYIRCEFQEESVQKNDLSLRIICIIIFAAEAVNLVRVLCLSSVGLETRNNRIYFAMYCILIFLAMLWLALQRSIRQAPMCRRQMVQYVITELFFLWHLGLNTYDLIRDPRAGTTVLTTALLARSLFIQIPPWYSLCQIIVDYIIFLFSMAPLLDVGDQLNLTITFAVSLAVSMAHFRHTIISLAQRKQILQANAKLQELVKSTSLTGLLNKAAVEFQANELLQRRDSNGVTLFILDLDNFKSVNDHFGHPCGDHVLVETANSIRDIFSTASGLSRVGGDEFAVLFDLPLTETQALSLGLALGERLKHIQWQGSPIEIGCSVGICICTLDQCTYRRLYTEADRMLYKAKKAGRGQCCIRQISSEQNIHSTGKLL